MGSFVYTVPAGSELGAGTHELSVTFTPADGANYTTASRSVSIVVAPVALTVRADNASKVYGQALPSFTATGTGFVNGDSMSSLGGSLAFATAATRDERAGIVFGDTEWSVVGKLHDHVCRRHADGEQSVDVINVDDDAESVEPTIRSFNCARSYRR